MFLSRNKKNNIYFFKLQFYYIKVEFKGVKIISACFRDEKKTNKKQNKTENKKKKKKKKKKKNEQKKKKPGRSVKFSIVLLNKVNRRTEELKELIQSDPHLAY